MRRRLLTTDGLVTTSTFRTTLPTRCINQTAEETTEVGRRRKAQATERIVIIIINALAITNQGQMAGEIVAMPMGANAGVIRVRILPEDSRTTTPPPVPDHHRTVHPRSIRRLRLRRRRHTEERSPLDIDREEVGATLLPLCTNLVTDPLNQADPLPARGRDHPDLVMENDRDRKDATGPGDQPKHPPFGALSPTDHDCPTCMPTADPP